MPKTYIIGNWKMNQKIEDVTEFFKNLSSQIIGPDIQKWIAPQFIHIPQSIGLASPFQIQIGAQNCATEEKGAFTGEISPAGLKDIGAHFVILGHSERRSLYQESNEIIAQKLKMALAAGLVVVLCVGETLEEREKGLTSQVVLNQLKNSLGHTALNPQRIIIAYEPVWAIGTGKTATPEEAQEVHSEIRRFLTNLDPVAGQKTSLLYGGSVKPSNIKDLMDKPDINGALVGGASLKAQDFMGLCAI